MRYKNYIKKQPVNRNMDSATARAIIEAASELFMERGYTDVSTREIATKAGVTAAMIPYCFGHKEELARVIFQKLKSDAMTGFRDPNIDELGSAEQLYIYTVLAWKRLDQSMTKFYYEFFLEARMNDFVSDRFEELSWAVIRDYKCNVSINENEMYLTAVAGTQQMSLIRILKQELNARVEDVFDLVISNYLYNIGLPDQTIAAVIERGKEYLGTLE